MNKSLFQFITPSIVDVAFTLNTSFNSNLSEVMMDNEFSINIINKKETSATVVLTVKINDKEESFQKGPCKISVTAASEFKWNEDVKSVDVLLKQNAPALLLSYIRPVITNLTVSANLPPYNLPFMDFTK